MSVALFRDLQLALVHLKRERLTGGPLAESESSQTRRRGRPLSWRRRCATATDHAWAGSCASPAACAAGEPVACAAWRSLSSAVLRSWPARKVHPHAGTASPLPSRAPFATAVPATSFHVG